MKPLYLDSAATTPVRKEVLKAMMPYYTDSYGNPSSSHVLGENARKAVESARNSIAREINAKPWEIFFTSGVTEANNWALSASVHNAKPIVISAIEHASINEMCNELEKKAQRIKRIPVTKEGLVRVDELADLIVGASLVSVMHANNVLGTIQPIAEIARFCRERGILFHTDAAQTFGKLKIDVRAMHIDLLSASAHKIGGPKGVGFLFVKENTPFKPFIVGGGQERGMRGGTENVASIVGFAKAIELSRKTFKGVEKTRASFVKEIEKLGGSVNGSREHMPHILHVTFKGIDANTLVAFLSHKNIYVSTGSACETRREKEDHVLEAIRMPRELQKGSIRISIDEKIKSSDAHIFSRALEAALVKSKSN